MPTMDRPMVDPELSRRVFPSGHHYEGVRIADNGIAHLGDTNISNIIREPLQNLLPVATNASFNSYDRQDEPVCLPNTRADLLREIEDWAERQDEGCIFWLNGWAGTGKSTVARTVARTYLDRNRLGATFFFSKGGGDVSHARKFFTSIAVQLAGNIPSLEQHIREVIIECKGIASQSLADQWRQLILGPLSKLDGVNHPSSYLLIVDALDECEGDNTVQILLRLLAEARSLKKAQLRILLTSRPEAPIRHGMFEIPQSERQCFILHNVPSASIDHDIFLLLQYSLGRVRQQWSLGAGWPGDRTLQQLVLNASGLFIWAATACRFIQEGKMFAVKRLDTILKGGDAVVGPEKHLDKIYIAVLKHSVSPDYTDEEKEELYDMLKLSLGSIVVLFSPLSTFSLSRLLQLSWQEFRTLDDLHAILDVPEDQTRPLRLHHPSFRDFLLDKKRCDSNFWVDEQQAHQILAARCIQLMSDSLKQDVCGQQAPGTLVEKVEGSQIEKSLPCEVQYACLYWVKHLERSSDQLCDEVYHFLQEHFLHWLEALSWIRKTSEGILAIISLEALISADIIPDLYTFVHDAKRFTQYNRWVIEQAPLQLYCSSLIFSPQKSIVRRQFQKDIPSWISRQPKVQVNWTAALQTLEGHTRAVSSVAFSPDGTQVVSGSWDQTVRLWDATTGAALQTLEGHTDAVSSVAFSPDGTQVVSGSWDQTVRLWDATTGAALQTLEGHTDAVRSVAFSYDGKMNTLLVSNSWIKDGQVDVIWLPPDYRATSTAFWDRNIALGHSSGKVSLLQVI